MNRNTALLEQTMQYINDHPEKHHQALYFDSCGTPMCFAGWAIHLSGHTMREAAESFDWPHCPVGISPTGAFAAKLLGLNQREACHLFSSTNSRPALELMVKDLVNGERLMDEAYYEKEAHPDAG